jgi:hydroxyacylglutathione hydrolase
MSTTAGSGAEIIAIETPALGDRSYLAHDGRVAPVVDPQRDIDRVLALAAARGLRISHVFETHLHNDYVTGGPALARLTGAAYHVNAADPVAFDRVPVRDGDVIEVSQVMGIRVLATPGHAPLRPYTAGHRGPGRVAPDQGSAATRPDGRRRTRAG